MTPEERRLLLALGRYVMPPRDEWDARVAECKRALEALESAEDAGRLTPEEAESLAMTMGSRAYRMQKRAERAERRVQALEAAARNVCEESAGVVVPARSGHLAKALDELYGILGAVPTEEPPR